MQISATKSALSPRLGLIDLIGGPCTLQLRNIAMSIATFSTMTARLAANPYFHPILTISEATNATTNSFMAIYPARAPGWCAAK